MLAVADHLNLKTTKKLTALRVHLVFTKRKVAFTKKIMKKKETHSIAFAMAVHLVFGSVKIEGKFAHIEVLNDIVAGFPNLARKRAEVPSGRQKNKIAQ